MIKPKNYDFSSKSEKHTSESTFLTFKTKLAFIKLKQVFVKTSIFYNYYFEYYIYIKTNISDYLIVRILDELILDDLGQ